MATNVLIGMPNIFFSLDYYLVLFCWMISVNFTINRFFFKANSSLFEVKGILKYIINSKNY